MIFREISCFVAMLVKMIAEHFFITIFGIKNTLIKMKFLYYPNFE